MNIFDVILGSKNQARNKSGNKEESKAKHEDTQPAQPAQPVQPAQPTQFARMSEEEATRTVEVVTHLYLKDELFRQKLNNMLARVKRRKVEKWIFRSNGEEVPPNRLGIVEQLDAIKIEEEQWEFEQEKE